MDQIQMDPCPSNAASAGNLRSQMFPSESQRHQGRYTSTVASIQIACNERFRIAEGMGCFVQSTGSCEFWRKSCVSAWAFSASSACKKSWQLQLPSRNFQGEVSKGIVIFTSRLPTKCCLLDFLNYAPKKDESSTDPKKMVPTHKTAFSKRRDLRDNQKFIPSHPTSNEMTGVGLSPLPVIVANEGLGWDSLLKMVHNPGGDSYWEGGQPNVFFSSEKIGVFRLRHTFFIYAYLSLRLFWCVTANIGFTEWQDWNLPNYCPHGIELPIEIEMLKT